MSTLLSPTALAIKSLKPCMDSVPDCIINPCTLATCPSFPAAECRDWMCGSECKPEFWANNAEVTSQCQTEKESSNPLAELLIPVRNVVDTDSCPRGYHWQCVGSSNSVSTGDPVINTGTLGAISPPTQQSDGGCPQGTPVAMCTARPCAVTTCPAFPTASCTDSYCGGCNAIFRLNGEDVTSQCNSVGVGPGTCPAGQTLTRCSARPCAIKTCPAHPRASCTDNYCGGCNAIFKVGLRDVTSECNGNSGPQMMSSSQINSKEAVVVSLCYQNNWFEVLSYGVCIP
ncbi:hypothetical protein BaRGS_00019452 [Batillaria attramentaria]|uniref:Uncharacterized protein n=1 Tax=Batillaria attramentaria TaxID=370345 RepID=A0ABD0KQB3_9CAEN